MARYGITVYEETHITRSVMLILEAETAEASKASVQERLDRGAITLDDLRARFPYRDYNDSESECDLFLGDEIVCLPEESDPNQMPLFGT